MDSVLRERLDSAKRRTCVSTAVLEKAFMLDFFLKQKEKSVRCKPD